MLSQARCRPDFQAAHNDPHNLFPAGGEVNGDRSAHPYGTVEGEPRTYGACDFEVGGRPKVAELGEGVRGELARAMLYMEERYGVDVRMPREALLEWHENDLPREWERGACATDRSRDRITEPLYRKPIVSIDRGPRPFRVGPLVVGPTAKTRVRNPSAFQPVSVMSRRPSSSPSCQLVPWMVSFGHDRS